MRRMIALVSLMAAAFLLKGTTLMAADTDQVAVV